MTFAQIRTNAVLSQNEPIDTTERRKYITDSTDEAIIAGGSYECSPGAEIQYSVYLFHCSKAGRNVSGLRIRLDQALIPVYDEADGIIASQQSAGEGSLYYTAYNSKQNIIGYGAISSKAVRSDGVLISFKLKVPYNAQPGTLYPIRIEADEWLGSDCQSLPVTVYDGWVHIQDGADYIPAEQAPTKAAAANLPNVHPASLNAESVVSQLTEAEGPDENGLTVVKMYQFRYTPPIWKTFLSDDRRTFRDIGPLAEQISTVSLSKYYVNAEGYFCDSDGMPQSTVLYAKDQPVPTGIKPFETKTMDISSYTKPKENEDSPAEIWNNEIKSVYPSGYTAKQAESIAHAHIYEIGMYYDASEQPDSDFKIGHQPICIGHYTVNIGIKGDTDFSNTVTAADAQFILEYYLSSTVAGMESYLCNDPAFHKLRFYISKVCSTEFYYDMTSDDYWKSAQTEHMEIEDAVFCLRYYVKKHLCFDSVNWKDIVGYDIPDNPPSTEIILPEETTTVSAATTTITTTTTTAATTTTTTATTTTPAATTTTYAPKPLYLRRDVNGDEHLDLKDVVIMRRVLANNWKLQYNEQAADVNTDGSFDLKDVVILRRYLVGGFGITLG